MQQISIPITNENAFLNAHDYVIFFIINAIVLIKAFNLDPYMSINSKTRSMRIALFYFLMMVSFSIFAQTLEIGTLTTNPPFSMQSSQNGAQQNFTGFEIDIMNEICNRIQYDCQYKAVDFHEIESMLNTNNIDAAIAAIIITPDRKQRFALSLPYKQSFIQFVTLKNNAITSVDELHDKTIGIYLDSPVRNYITNTFKGQTKTKEYTHSESLFDALVSKQVAAIVTNYESAAYWSENLEPSFRFLGNKIAFGEGYGIMAKLANQALIDKINQALLSMENDGTYLKIYQDNLSSF